MVIFCLFILIISTFGEQAANHFSPCLPEQRCWPSENQWKKFNESIHGNLIKLKPFFYNCHEPHYDEELCSLAWNETNESFVRTSNPSTAYTTFFETVKMKGCIVNDGPCYQGAVSIYAVNVSCPEDVQNAIQFASNYNIRIAIRGSGHDFLGRSSAAGSLLIWTHYYQDVTFHDSFVPNGCKIKGIPAATVQSGANAIDVYAAADEAGVLIVGPAVSDVALLGGFCQGGGHSPVSNNYGLCVDNVLQYKVVDAKGRLVIANECQNQDLFWALRGGGGGTFGVVLEGTVKTHPPSTVIFAYYIVDFPTDNPANVKAFLKEFTKISVSWSDAGWIGYMYLYETQLILSNLILDATEEYALSTITPLIDIANNLGVSMNGELIPFPSFYEFFVYIIAPSPYNEPDTATFYTLASRLIPRTVMVSDSGSDKLVDALLYILDQVAPSYVELNMVGGGAVARLGNGTSVTPAWRKAIWEVVYSDGWQATDTWKVANEVMQALTSMNQKLIDITPDSGTYQNEANLHEPHFQQSFWGKENYAKLLKIKWRVDPFGLFRCNECVGSEFYHSHNGGQGKE